MNKEKLKTQIRKGLGVGEIPEVVWRKLEEGGHVDEVLTYSASSEDCISLARMFYEVWQDGKSVGRRGGTSSSSEHTEMNQTQEKVASRLYEYEDERSKAYSAYVAKAATGDRRVRRFRKAYLSRNLLTEKEAEDMENRSRRFKNALGRLCSYLSANYPWGEDEAKRFVLTGKPPEVVPLFARTRLRGDEENNLFSYGAITLTVEPWISAESVERFYREMQRQMFGRKPREGRPRNLAVFRFVVDHSESVEWERPKKRDEKGNLVTLWGHRERNLVNKPSWAKLLKAWNELYPEGHEWHYKGRWNFQRDFYRATSVVPFPITSSIYSALSPAKQRPQDSAGDAALAPSNQQSQQS